MYDTLSLKSIVTIAENIRVNDLKKELLKNANWYSTVCTMLELYNGSKYLEKLSNYPAALQYLMLSDSDYCDQLLATDICENYYSKQMLLNVLECFDDINKKLTVNELYDFCISVSNTEFYTCLHNEFLRRLIGEYSETKNLIIINNMIHILKVVDPTMIISYLDNMTDEVRQALTSKYFSKFDIKEAKDLEAIASLCNDYADDLNRLCEEYYLYNFPNWMVTTKNPIVRLLNTLDNISTHFDEEIDDWIEFYINNIVERDIFEQEQLSNTIESLDYEDFITLCCNDTYFMAYVVDKELFYLLKHATEYLEDIDTWTLVKDMIEYGNSTFLKKLFYLVAEGESISDRSSICRKDIYEEYLDYDQLTVDDIRELNSLKVSDYELPHREYKIEFIEFKRLMLLPISYIKLAAHLEEFSGEKRTTLLQRLFEVSALTGIRADEDIRRVADLLKQKDLIEMYEKCSCKKFVGLNRFVKLLIHVDYKLIQQIKDEMDLEFLTYAKPEYEEGILLKDLEKEYLYGNRNSIRLQWMFHNSRRDINQDNLRYLCLTSYGENICNFLLDKNIKTGSKEFLKSMLASFVYDRYYENRYGNNALGRVLAYKIPESIEAAWCGNYERILDEYTISETDSFLDILSYGSAPIENSYNFAHGVARDCLVSLCESNRKIINVYRKEKLLAQGQVILTRLIRKDRCGLAIESNYVDSSEYRFVLVLDQVYYNGSIDSNEKEVCQKLLNGYVMNRSRQISAQGITCLDADENFKVLQVNMFIPLTRCGRQKINLLQSFPFDVLSEGTSVSHKVAVY